MAQTPPPTLDPLPTAPNTASPGTFSLLMDTFLAALIVFRTQLVAAILNVYNNAVDAFNSATAAAGSATAAAAAVNAARFVSGFNYAQDAAAISALDFYTYRRKTAGAGTIDPKNDPTNWVLMNAVAVPLASYQNAVVLDATGPFIPTVTGWHEIEITGAAGSGGVAAVSLGHKVASGAGAGGFCLSKRWLIAGQPCMFTSGAGVVAKGSNPGSQNGVDGGVTTFSGPNMQTMTANGGKGGRFAAAGPVPGGDGGTASGGDINITGGRGGNITGTGTALAATGGGAVGLFGQGRNGGDIAHSGAPAASGGASPGGDGGSVTSTSGPVASGGGGMAGAAPSVATAGMGQGGKAGVLNAPNRLLANAGGLQGLTSAVNPGTANGGAGSGGVVTPSNGFTAASAGVFAGSGGTVITDNSQSLPNVGQAAGGDFGGASGGIVYQTGGSFILGGATSGGKAIIRF